MVEALTLIRDSVSRCKPLRDFSDIAPQDELYCDLDLDSLDVVSIAIDIEEATGREISDRVIARWRTVADIEAAVGEGR